MCLLEPPPCPERRLTAHARPRAYPGDPVAGQPPAPGQRTDCGDREAAGHCGDGDRQGGVGCAVDEHAVEVSAWTGVSGRPCGQLDWPVVNEAVASRNGGGSGWRGLADLVVYTGKESMTLS